MNHSDWARKVNGNSIIEQIGFLFSKAPWDRVRACAYLGIVTHSRTSGRVFYFRPGERTVRQGSEPFSSRERAICHLVTYASCMLHTYPDHVTNRQSFWVQIQLHHRSVISARYYVEAPPKRKI